MNRKHLHDLLDAFIDEREVVERDGAFEDRIPDTNSIGHMIENGDDWHIKPETVTVALYRSESGDIGVDLIKEGSDFQRIPGTETEIAIPAPEPEVIELVEHDNTLYRFWMTPKASQEEGIVARQSGRRGTLTITEGEKGVTTDILKLYKKEGNQGE